MKLVIVESPTKAKTISQFIKNGYKVESSYGHIRDLPKSKLGIEVEKNFEPQYVIPTKAKKLVNGLKKTAQKSERVVLATDEDREGEAIAWHLTKALALPPEKTERIVFHEITKNAIETALKNPRQINESLVNAQQGRRILDRLVGYKLSPFLWKKVASGLSAGRVQSVTVRLIVEREEEIKKFKPEEYWTLKATLQKETGEALEASLIKINGKTIEKLELKSQGAINEILSQIKNSEFTVSKIDKKEVKKNPLPPFTTSTLQQTAAKKLGYSAKKTMLMAQRLYEKGLITYMRTDSVNLSKESLAAAKIWLEKELGVQYASQAPRTFTTKSRLAQEAHEAIRPTDPSEKPTAKNIDDQSELKLYELIWSRFLASQMPQAEFYATQADIESGQYTFRANGNVLKFDGFLKIWKQKFEENQLPELTAAEKLTVKELVPAQHFTEPPPRYTEASLIKTLEEYGIGRPSTYAPTISVIQTRNYVEKQQGKFLPTEMGTLVNKVLTENFPEIVDIDFTAKMESSLDEVAEGNENWRDLIGAFYTPFSKNLEKKYKEVTKTELIGKEATGINCDKCGKPMVVKFSRFGKFLACSGFPECRNTKSLKEEPKKIGMQCPKCLASPDPATLDNPGDIIEKRVSRGKVRGKIFWGCNRYPKCDYASWANPLNPEPEKDQPKENLEEKPRRTGYEPKSV
ncbi:MAG: type I DNA topoisomerase [Candidatus Harrisonbacteria bacterium]|nr:type I DNA topoisomerase [Candidatus Harrisonbacteria bacterium]